MINPAFAADQGERPFWPRRNWWLALLAILLLAGALRFTGYDFGLPFVDTGESHYLLDARLVIDFGTAKSLNMHHYPPGIIALNYALLRAFQEEGQPPASLLGAGRLIAISASIALLITLALFGYHAFGPPAGLLAAALTAITPTFVFYSRLQTADIYVTFFSILALWLAQAGARHRRRSWAVYATYALMLAIVFKYQAVFIAPWVLFSPLLYGLPAARRAIIGNLARFALFSCWLIFLTPALEAFQAPAETELIASSWVRHVQWNQLPGLSQISAGLRTVLAELDWRVLLPGLAGLLWLPLAKDGAGAGGRRALVHIALAALSWLVGVSLFDETNIRFYLAPAALLWLLAGAGYAAWLAFLQRRSRKLGPRSGRALLPAAALLLVALNIPQLRLAIADARQAALPDSRVDLMHYMDTTLAAGRVMADQANHKTLNRDWGGYPGSTQFDYLRKDAGSPPLTIAPMAHWRAQGILYAIMPHQEHQALLQDDPAGYLSETTLLKSFPPSAAHRGPAMVVLRLYPIQHEATGRLGPIRLIGYDMDERSARPGATLPFHLYWQATAATDGDYQVFNHLLDGEGKLVAQIDGPPLPDPLPRRGTGDWHDPEEIVFSREFALELPEDLPPGAYTLFTGFYHPDSGQRLFSPTGEDSLWVASIAVK